MPQTPTFIFGLILMFQRNIVGSIDKIISVIAAMAKWHEVSSGSVWRRSSSGIHPCAIPIALIASSDQQCPGIDLFQFSSTGVHCGKMAAASSKLVIELKAINDQKNNAHRALVGLWE